MRGKTANHRERERKKKEREKREAWTIPQGQSDVQSFVFCGTISGLCKPREDRRSNWRPGRNRCSYTMNTHLVGCLFTKSQGGWLPLFLRNKENHGKESRLPTCRPVSGKNVAEAIRLRYSVIYVLLKIHSYNRWASIYGHDKMFKLHIILVCTWDFFFFFWRTIGCGSLDNRTYRFFQSFRWNFAITEW